MISERQRNLFGGVVMIAVGASAASLGAGYRLGSLSAVGPGFFPTVLGVILVLLGVFIAVSPGDHLVAADQELRRRSDWRGWGCIVGGVLLFLGLAIYAGLLPATVACVFVTAMGDRDATWKGSLALAAGVAVFAAIVFHWLLQISFPS